MHGAAVLKKLNARMVSVRREFFRSFPYWECSYVQLGTSRPVHFETDTNI
jgi:hypothetical protein